MLTTDATWQKYEAVYEPVQEAEDDGAVAFIKLFDAGRQFVASNYHSGCSSLFYILFLFKSILG